MSLITTDWAIILLIGFFSHFLLLFNSGRYWDSWIISAWQMRRDDAAMERFYREVGMPAWYYAHRFMGRLPHFIYWYNALTFINLLVGPILVFEICLHTGFLPHRESLMIACLATALPLPQMIVDYIVGMHYVCTLTLFYAAWLLILPTLPTSHMPVVQALACVLFFLSFNMNSLLMFFCWSYLITFLVQYQIDGTLTLSYFAGYAAQTWYLLLLPVLFWILKATLTPTSGAYAKYNKPALPKFRVLAQKVCGLFSTALYQVAADAIGYALKNPVLVLLLVFEMAGLIYVKPWGQDEPALLAPHHTLVLIGLGLSGLAFAGLPYLLVGQSFGNLGWVTKNNTLLSVPAACCFTGLLTILLKPVWLPYFTGLLVGAFVFYWNYNYLRWYAISAKYSAILDKLGKISDLRTYGVIGLWDRHYLSAGSEEHPEHGHGCSTVSYMLSFLNEQKPFCVCFPDVEERILLTDGGRYSKKTVDDLIRTSTIDYGFIEVDRNGLQALAIFNSGRRRFRIETVAFRFLYYRLFCPGKLETLYDKLIELEFIPLPRDLEKPVLHRI